MKKYRIQIDYGSQGEIRIGGYWRALWLFIRHINSGAYIKVTKIK